MAEYGGEKIEAGEKQRGKEGVETEDSNQEANQEANQRVTANALKVPMPRVRKKRNSSGSYGGQISNALIAGL